MYTGQGCFVLGQCVVLIMLLLVLTRAETLGYVLFLHVVDEVLVGFLRVPGGDSPNLP